jgi:ElaB/YqjD/DUF883 family membrane-anchored ribosome-binding protein
MSTGASQKDTGDAGSGGPEEVDATAAPPLADDRPFVDGAAASPEELRAEVERLRDEDRQYVDELREEVGESVAELAARLDVKARLTEKKDEAVATVHHQVDRARTAVAGGASAARNTAEQRPGVLVGVGAALIVLVVVVLRRRRG